jgi:murein DD-endopeptidase MepM/ murein hydrolase activator NlpD
MANLALSAAAAILLKAAQEAERTVGNSITVVARVVSPPIPLSDADKARIYGAEPAAVTERRNRQAPMEDIRAIKSIFVFRAHIADSDWEQNPHRFIPDPCDLSQIPGTSLYDVQKIINLCTQFTSGHSYEGIMPKVGDWVNVRLNKIRQPGSNAGSWDTANGDFVEMALKVPLTSETEDNCKSMVDLFGGDYDFVNATPPGATGAALGGRFINSNSESTTHFDRLIPATVQARWPLSGRIVSGFTYYRKFKRKDDTWSESPHPGIDIAAIVGTEIFSPLPDGIVTNIVTHCRSTNDKACGSGFGNQVKIKYVINGKEIYTSYNHLGVVSVAEDDIVDATTKIGEVGMTGYTGGPHLHFEVYDGTPTIRHRISPGSPHGDPNRMSHADPMQSLGLTPSSSTSDTVIRAPATPPTA